MRRPFSHKKYKGNNLKFLGRVGLDLDYQLGNFHYPRSCVWISGSRFLASGVLFFGNWLSIFASEGCFCASGEAGFDLWDSTLASIVEIRLLCFNFTS